MYGLKPISFNCPLLIGDEVLEQAFDGVVDGAVAVVTPVAEGRLLDGK
jgi:hypothetical protein